MKIALCTTTIHVPYALKLMRKYSADVKFFVATDEKTPVIAHTFDANSSLLTTTNQQKWKCSGSLGWNTIARRNIAFLEALKWGADVLYSWDDDNIPVENCHFDHIQLKFQSWPYAGGDPRYNGIQVTGTDGWFDPGTLLIPPTRHRGFPHDKPASKQARSITEARIGVAAGLIIGNPDIDASTRIEKAPDIAQVHILGSTGVVVDPRTWTVFNSQNTAVIRELVPAWFMMPGIGRHDDIYASLIVQRVARERNYHVYFGPPFCYQQRNEHDLLKDLRAEIDGMENVVKLADLLDHIPLPAKSVIEDVRIIYQQLCHCDFIPTKSAEAGLLWLEDCEGVL